MDKNRSTAIAPIFKFVIEFLQSILLHYRVFAIEFFLQSIFLQSSFCTVIEFFYNRVFAIEFFCSRVFAIVFFFYNPVFAADLASIIEHHFLFSPRPYSIQVPVPMYLHDSKVKKMAATCRTH